MGKEKVKLLLFVDDDNHVEISSFLLKKFKTMNLGKSQDARTIKNELYFYILKSTIYKSTKTMKYSDINLTK
jgi:hypothetical protein